LRFDERLADCLVCGLRLSAACLRAFAITRLPYGGLVGWAKAHLRAVPTFAAYVAQLS
jgi:hypothetical protein